MIAENLKIDSYRIPAVLRTLDILEILRDASHPLSAMEISAITETSRSTVYRILKTLAWRGYVRQEAYGKFSLASTTWSRIDPKAREYDLISKVRELFETSSLSRYEIAEVLLEVFQPGMQQTPAKRTRRSYNGRLDTPAEAARKTPTDGNTTTL